MFNNFIAAAPLISCIIIFLCTVVVVGFIFALVQDDIDLYSVPLIAVMILVFVLVGSTMIDPWANYKIRQDLSRYGNVVEHPQRDENQDGKPDFVIFSDYRKCEVKVDELGKWYVVKNQCQSVRPKTEPTVKKKAR